MNFLQILILSLVQGAAELLPVSSSAHVIFAEKLMGLDPTSPQLTLFLVMLHTGTMFAVIVYFWKAWRQAYFESMSVFGRSAFYVLLASAVTGCVGLLLEQGIKHLFAANAPGFEIEQLFGNSKLMAAALAGAGCLIFFSSRIKSSDAVVLSPRVAAWVGAVQGLCLPFRGFSRSGATISTAMVLGLNRRSAEEFSFALALALTPAVILKEAYRLLKMQSLQGAAHSPALMHLLAPGLLGMVLSFLAGLLALRWLSSWLEKGRWHFFGLYCLLFSLVVLVMG